MPFETSQTQIKSHYEALGISQDATPAEIKSAYRKLAKEVHPDIAKDDGSKFRELNEAYAALIDTDKRVEYDRYGTQDQRSSSSDSEQNNYDSTEGANTKSYETDQTGKSWRQKMQEDISNARRNAQKYRYEEKVTNQQDSNNYDQTNEGVKPKTKSELINEIYTILEARGLSKDEVAIEADKLVLQSAPLERLERTIQKLKTVK